jgi:hypothetical protein
MVVHWDPPTVDVLGRLMAEPKVSSSAEWSEHS